MYIQHNCTLLTNNQLEYLFWVPQTLAAEIVVRQAKRRTKQGRHIDSCKSSGARISSMIIPPRFQSYQMISKHAIEMEVHNAFGDTILLKFIGGYCNLSGFFNANVEIVLHSQKSCKTFTRFSRMHDLTTKLIRQEHPT